MALIDYEAAWADLRAHVRSKDSHGKRELTDLMADLEVTHRREESLLETVGRVYLLPAIVDENDTSSTGDPAGVNGHGVKLAPS